MPYFKTHKISPAKLQKLRLDLYRKLRKEAFDHYFQCQGCGAHQDLEVHHIAYDPDHFDDPAWYEILCRACHSKRHRRR